MTSEILKIRESGKALYCLKEASEVIGRTYKALIRLHQKGRLKTVKIEGRLFVTSEDLAQFLSKWSGVGSEWKRSA